MDTIGDASGIEEFGRNFYRKLLWAVLTRPARAGEIPQERLLEHLRYQVDLEKRGLLFAAGPLSGPLSGPDDLPSGYGLILIRAENEKEARTICDADPLHASGLRIYDLFKWHMHEGRISMTITLSDSRFDLA
jgi:uncharacterized protein YciI